MTAPSQVPPAAESAPTEDPWGERLPRRLGLWSAVAVVVGSTIGSGIFRTPAVVAERITDVPTFAAGWILGAVVALCGALAYAELGAMFPRTGGIYVYLRETFGPLPAFLFGWAELLVLRPAAYGAIAVTSAEYTCRLVGVEGAAALGPLPISVAQGGAVAMIVGVGLINVRGVTLGAIVQNWSTVLKMGALVVLIVLGLGMTAEHPLPAREVVAPMPGAGGLAAFGLAMVGILWAYDGWADVSFVSGEVQQPQRNLPRAFILGTVSIVVLYLLINAAYLAVVPLDQMPGSPLIAADVAYVVLGPVGMSFVAGAVALSTFGTLNGTFMTGPRVFYAMAEDRLFFRALADVHPRFGTPHRSIYLSIVLGVIFVSIRSFAELADQFVIGIWPFYALGVLAVFVLRKREPERARPYRTWGYPVVPAVFLLATVYLLGSYLITQPLLFAADFGVIATGFPMYLWWRRRRTADDG